MALTDSNSEFPRLKLNRPQDTRDMMEYMNMRSGLVPSDIIAVIYEIRDALLRNLPEATPLRLEGIGIFSPSLKLDGSINIRFRPDKKLVRQLNGKKDRLKPRITNRKNIGKSLDDLKCESTE